jgi:hypothetical protein
LSTKTIRGPTFAISTNTLSFPDSSTTTNRLTRNSAGSAAPTEAVLQAQPSHWLPFAEHD